MPERYQRRYKSLRLWEFITCAVCFGLAISTFIKHVPLSEFIKAILFITSLSYLFLTIVDIIMISASKSIPWMPWLPLATAASLLYFLCSGFLIFAKMYIETVVYEIILVSYVVGGILFLLDVILIIHAPFLAPEESQNLSATRKSGSYRSLPEIEHQNKSVQVQLDIEYNINAKEHLIMKNEAIQIPTREHPPLKRLPSGVSSHGGTFHVSKMVVPISTIASKNSEPKKEEHCDCELIKVRSVGIGVKPALKHSEEPSKIPTAIPSTPATRHYSKSITYSVQGEKEIFPHFDNNFNEANQPRPRSDNENKHNTQQHAFHTSDKPKRDDYMIYHCTTTTDSEISTGSSSPEDLISKPHESILVTLPLLSTLDEEIGNVKRLKAERKYKSARANLETSDNEALESEDYKSKLYSFIYPVKPVTWGPQSHFDVEAGNTLYSLPEQNFTCNSGCTQQLTLLPGAVESQESSCSTTVNVRKQTISNEPTSYSRQNKYLRVSDSNKPQRSKSSTHRTSDERKINKNCPFM